jgi:hypothetical protein
MEVSLKRRGVKAGDLLPWFLEDHGTLPQWYLDDTQKFFDWLQAHQRERGRVGPKATSSQAKIKLDS